MLLAEQSTLTTLAIFQVVVMVTIAAVLRAQHCLTPPTLPTLVSTLISKATNSADVNNVLATSLPDDLPGDDEDVDGLYPTSESEESEWDDDGDIGLEPEPTPQVANHNNTNEAAHTEDLGSDGSPLLNHAEQAEVEQSQEPGLSLEIVTFGGKAGQPIRVGQPTTADGCQTQLRGDPEAANPYAPFCSQTDWEVAKWGKLRGPTSTAFTELLEIPNVSSQATRIVT